MESRFYKLMEKVDSLAWMAFFNTVLLCMVLFNGCVHNARAQEPPQFKWQCGPQGCVKVPVLSSTMPAKAATAPRRFEWVQLDDDPDQWALYFGEIQVGNASASGGWYRPKRASGFGDACEPPVPAPAKLPVPKALPRFDADSHDVKADQVEELLPEPMHFVSAQTVEDPPTGVDASKLGKGAEFRVCQGSSCKDVSREQAVEMIEQGLPDDSRKLRLTVIGTADDRKRVEADLAGTPELADLRSAVNLWSCEPSHWSVADAGFVVVGKPTIYLQAPSGKVLHRQDTYSGVGDLQAIRKKAVDYDPSKDADLTKIVISPQLKLDELIPPASMLVLIGGGIYLLGRKS